MNHSCAFALGIQHAVFFQMLLNPLFLVQDTEPAYEVQPLIHLADSYTHWQVMALQSSKNQEGDSRPLDVAGSQLLLSPTAGHFWMVEGCLASIVQIEIISGTESQTFQEE